MIINFDIPSHFYSGLMMLLDIPEERSGDLDLRWGEPKDCRFPLFSFVKPLSLARMGLVYCLMWIGEFRCLATSPIPFRLRSGGNLFSLFSGQALGLRG